VTRHALVLILIWPTAVLAGGGRVEMRSDNDLLTAIDALVCQECLVITRDQPVVLDLEGPGHLEIWSRISLPAEFAGTSQLKLAVFEDGRRREVLAHRATTPAGAYDETDALRPGPIEELDFDVPNGRHRYRFLISSGRHAACVGFAYRLPDAEQLRAAEEGKAVAGPGLVPLVPLAPLAPAPDEQEVLSELDAPAPRPAAAELQRKQASDMPDLPDEDDVPERGEERRLRRDRLIRFETEEIAEATAPEARQPRRPRAAITVSQDSPEQRARRAAALRAKREREASRDETARAAALRAKEERERRRTARERGAPPTAGEVPFLPGEEDAQVAATAPEPPPPPVIDADLGVTPRGGFFLPLGPFNPTGMVSVEVRYHLPFFRRRLSLGASVGYLRTGRQAVAEGPRPTEYQLDLDVVPLTADLVLRLPLVPDVFLFLGAGGGYHLAWVRSRARGASEHASGGAFGYHGLLGMSLALPYGEAALSARYASAVGDLGDVCRSCELGGVGVELSYQFLF